MLDWNQISNALGESRSKIRCHVVIDCITSTNDWSAWSCGNEQLPAICLAEQQTSGRGRSGREWISPPAENICLSLVWPFSVCVNSRLDGLSLVIGVAIARVMAVYGIQAKIKWPNDVLVNGDKIAGILIETKIKPSGDAIAIIGVGINYALSELSRLHIGQACCDMASHFKSRISPDRNQVAGMVIKELIHVCEEFTQYGFSAFIKDWNHYDVCSGRDVQVHDASGVWIGKVIGLNDRCGLRVLRNNSEHVVYAADVSIRIK